MLWPRSWSQTFIKVRMQEAILANEKMHGKLACGRPLVVRLSSERYALETPSSSTKAVSEGHKLHLTGGGTEQTSRSAKIAAIKNKLKSLEEDNSRSKKQKQNDNVS
ncbi:putative RNA-binding protein [Trifolium repens]|nr:putative RNA-binding protein [Trifolium repens]